MYYHNYYWGMNPIWWILWTLLLIWIFALPYDVPFQRKRKNSALQILLNRFAAGEITAKVYEDMKAIIKSDLQKHT